MFDPNLYTTDAANLPREQFEWGTLQWLCDGKISRGAEQTIGIATILPGQRNPRHYHPNCEEVLTMLEGTGVHSFEDAQIELRPGMTIRIPIGVTHNMANTGSSPIVCLICFNTGNRKTVFID